MGMPRVGWGGMSDSKCVSDLGEATMSGLKKKWQAQFDSQSLNSLT